MMGWLAAKTPRPCSTVSVACSVAVPVSSLSLPRLLLLFVVLAQSPAAAGAGLPWVTQARDGTPRLQLYFFWSQRCPHCLEALPFVKSLAMEHPWIELHSHELNASRDNVELFVKMAEALGQEARSVPAFFLCGQMLTGFDGAEGTGREILSLAERCRSQGPAANPGAGLAMADGGASVRLPLLGEVDAQRRSLPLLTVVIAGLDAFNPCAFFVLLFLLSLMVHARSRRRMLLVGGTFVLFSGLVYFLFMAAWLNLFLVIGGAPVVTLVAGLVAVIIGLLNTKDYFYFQQGPSLAIPETAKPGLYRRMRGLIGADSLGTMLLGTVALALAANSYELLCTAGFPMVFTRLLTLRQLDGLEYYGYLLLYNLIYVLPLLAIVILFTFTLGARKLSERQGRVLKLLSGVMMLGLGLVMLLVPGLLDRLWVGAVLLASAAAITLVVTALDKGRARFPGGGDAA